MELVTEDMANETNTDIDREALELEYQAMLVAMVIKLRERAARELGINPQDLNRAISAMPADWSTIAPAAAWAIDRDPTVVARLLSALEGFGRLQFPLDGIDSMGDLISVAYCARGRLGDFGEVFWRALRFAYADDLITMAEAANMTGTTIANMSQHGRLTFFHDPDAPTRQGSRLVLRSQVIEFYGQPKSKSG